MSDEFQWSIHVAGRITGGIVALSGTGTHLLETGGCG
jgi:hypothetical protein